ncbi:site-specific integrase [Paraburkholderia sediminicola]|uniref:site-specific integrase n=1 Tax=Paraburkholderia sediminicola TaxID=458836 RepID=UPI0038B6BBCD
MAKEYGVDVEKDLLAQLPVPVSEPKTIEAKETDFMSEELGTVVELFMESKQVRKRKRHAGVAPTVIRNVGGAKVASICYSWVAAYIDRMSQTISKRGGPFSYNSICSQLVLISLAVRWRAHSFDLEPPYFPPYSNLIPEGVDEPRDRRLEPHEERQLMHRLQSLPKTESQFWPLLVRLALETAARQQELVGAEWKEFTFDGKKAWWIIPAAHTKSKKLRKVPLGREVQRIVRELESLRDPQSQRLFHVFKSPKLVSNQFARHVRAAGIVGLRFHDLRHEAISRIVIRQRKMSVYTIMAMVGHSSLDMLNRYANLRGEELAEMVD